MFIKAHRIPPGAPPHPILRRAHPPIPSVPVTTVSQHLHMTTQQNSDMRQNAAAWRAGYQQYLAVNTYQRASTNAKMPSMRNNKKNELRCTALRCSAQHCSFFLSTRNQNYSKASAFHTAHKTHKQ